MRPFLTLHDPAAARSFYAKGLWTEDTFYTLMARHAIKRPEAMALRDGRARLDWQTLKARVDAMADDMCERGITAGDRVSIWMGNRVETIIAFLACSREGIACNPSLHRTYTCAEIVDLLSELQSKALITEPGWGADRKSNDFDAMLAQLSFLKKVYKANTFPMHITQLTREPHANPDSIAYLAFTSGTTGKPKCVMHSCNTLLANARDLVRDWKVGPDDTMLTLRDRKSVV